jgi:integrase
MAKKRGNKEGTIYLRGDGRWCGQITTGYDTITGKYTRVTVYGATQREALERLRKAQEEAKEARSGMRLAYAVDNWLASAKARVAPASYTRYIIDLQPAVATLGAIKITELSALQVQNAQRAWEADGISRNHQSRCLKRLKQVLKQCARYGLVSTNVAEIVDLPRHRPEEINPLNKEQVRVLLAAVSGTRHEALVRLALDSGARIGEMLALEWADFDFEAREVYLNKTLDAYKPETRPTKTRKSRRRVELTAATVACLLVLKTEHRHERLVFPNKRGRYIIQNNLYKQWWKGLRESLGWPHLRFHDLRHTCASLLLLANVHPLVVSTRLGHANINITLNTYSHLLPGVAASAVTALEGFLQ